MNTGQTMITVGALILAVKIIMGFYGNLATNGTSLGTSEAGISQISLAASYYERAQSLNVFDDKTYNKFVNDSSQLTAPSSLGIDPKTIYPDSSYDSTGTLVIEYDTVINVQNQLSTYNDFDDFNGTELDDTTLATSLGTFHTSFSVYYVKPDSVTVKANYRTFMKRLDMKIWRKSPPGSDTLRATKILGYFHFD